MSSVILFASRNGATRTVAEAISKRIGADMIDLAIEKRQDVSQYDVIIFGSGIYSGKPTRILKYAKDNASVLRDKKVFLYLCCLYNGERGDAQLDSVASQIPDLCGKAYFSERSSDKEKDIDDFITMLLS